ncbi:MAG: hypothetical protein JSV03_05185 [Planctomycetota bacterium]|nr:MAG: hypothetical protein JSV03_05185 [Planctomycetota bacterium]
MRHLTDNEIQSFLNGCRAEERTRLERHISKCPDCRKHLRLYRRLGDAISSSLSDDTPEGFETAVLDRLRAVRRIKRIADLVTTVVACTGFALIALVVILSPQLSQVFSEYLTQAERLFGPVIRDMAVTSDSADVLAFAIVLFVLFALLDRLVTVGFGLGSRQDQHPARE